MLRIALIGLSELIADDNALPSLPAVPIALEAAPIAFEEAIIDEFKSSPIILSFWYNI
jgi:hypothetical protein